MYAYSKYVVKDTVFTLAYFAYHTGLSEEEGG